MSPEPNRRTLATAVLGLALTSLGCKEQPPSPVASPAPPPVATPPPPEANPDVPASIRSLRWETVSEDARSVLTQTADLQSRCVTACTVGGKALWSGTTCMGQRIDLRFVGNDCERAVVLHHLPRAASRWQTTEVVHSYLRGQLDLTLQAGGVVRDGQKIQSAGSTFYWLSGAAGRPGPPPRYANGGQAVEFETVDGSRYAIPLTAAGRVETRK